MLRAGLQVHRGSSHCGRRPVEGNNVLLPRSRPVAMNPISHDPRRPKDATFARTPFTAEVQSIWLQLHVVWQAGPAKEHPEAGDPVRAHDEIKHQSPSAPQSTDVLGPPGVHLPEFRNNSLCFGHAQNANESSHPADPSHSQDSSAATASRLVGEEPGHHKIPRDCRCEIKNEPTREQVPQQDSRLVGDMPAGSCVTRCAHVQHDVNREVGDQPQGPPSRRCPIHRHAVGHCDHLDAHKQAGNKIEPSLPHTLRTDDRNCRNDPSNPLQTCATDDLFHLKVPRGRPVPLPGSADREVQLATKSVL
mmetsp:Transcript_25711/g.62181  ORF Transcript_25711/g.62181 Transcript_25711/m.62181 type:complete len:305 (-) Transcript_25711:1015-1929(-)